MLAWRRTSRATSTGHDAHERVLYNPGMPRPTTSEIELPLRIHVTSPPAGVVFCMQGKPGECLSPVRSTGDDLTFDVEVRAIASDPPRLLGKVTQGPPAARFLYVCSGTYAGETSTVWARRAKVPLSGITRELIEKRQSGERLCATIAGRAKDGGPACASVKLLGAGWRWSRS